MNIILGVAGGIAAYKSPEIVRRLKDAGHDVRVVMTAGAEAFITPAHLSGRVGRAGPPRSPRRDGGGRDGPYRARPLGGRGARRPSHRAPDGTARARLRGRPPHHPLPRHSRPDRPRAGHEPADVARGRDPRQPGGPGRARGPGHRPRRGLAGVRRRGAGTDERARGHRVRAPRRERAARFAGVRAVRCGGGAPRPAGRGPACW